MTNAKLYEIEYDDADILHRGDMNITELMYSNIKNDVSSEDLADQYWKSEITQSPKIEILLPEAIVTRIISNSEAERSKALAERMGLIP